MTMNDELTVDDIIWAGGGAKSAEWPAIGSWVGGPIQNRPQKYQPTEYVKGAPAGSGKPRLTRDGKPVFGIRVDVQTSQRDPEVANDDGVRRMHLDKWRQHAAIRDALKEAGVRQLEVGGELWVQWTGLDTESDAGQPAKTWTAKYRPPAGSVHAAQSVVDPGPTFTQPTHAPAPVEPPAYQQAPTVQPHQAYGSTPVQPPAPAQQPGPAWGGATPSPAPAMPAETPVQPAPPIYGHAAPSPQQTAQQAAPVEAQNTITSSVAAALRAQGVDTSMFTVVPG